MATTRAVRAGRASSNDYPAAGITTAMFPLLSTGEPTDGDSPGTLTTAALQELDNPLPTTTRQGVPTSGTAIRPQYLDPRHGPLARVYDTSRVYDLMTPTSPITPFHRTLLTDLFQLVLEVKDCAAGERALALERSLYAQHGPYFLPYARRGTELLTLLAGVTPIAAYSPLAGPTLPADDFTRWPPERLVPALYRTPALHAYFQPELQDEYESSLTVYFRCVLESARPTEFPVLTRSQTSGVVLLRLEELDARAATGCETGQAGMLVLPG